MASSNKSSSIRSAWKIGSLIFLYAVFLLINLPDNGLIEKAKRSRTITAMQAMKIASQSYVSDGGSFPKNLDNHALYLILSDAGSNKAYMFFEPHQINSANEIIDAWKTPFRVSYVSNTKVRIVSAADDKTLGTADDIISQ